MRIPRQRVMAMMALGSVFLSACATAGPARQSDGQRRQDSAPRRTKTLNLGVTGGVQAMSLAGANTPTGGWVAITELHSEGLVNSEVDSHKPIGRLAEKVPSLDDGSISLLPDGRMRVVFSLRKG